MGEKKTVSRYILVDGIPREIKASVCTITKRREPLIAKMIEALNRQTCLGFEYILVDGYYFQRKDIVLKMFEEMDPQFPIRYVPDKPTRWRGKRPALSSARNTYIIWARGEQVIGVDDCCVDMCPDLVEKHLYWGKKGYAVTGSWRDGDGWESRHQIFSRPQVVEGGLFYGANASYRLEDVLTVNGYEELLDGEQGQEDVHLGIRLSRVRVKTVYDPSLWVEFDRSTHTLTQWSPDATKADWKKEGVPREPKRRRLDDGELHFSNEWITQELIKKQSQYRPIGNSFNLEKLREIPPRYKYDVLKVHEALAQYVDTTPTDWRDGELIVDIVGAG